MSRKTFIKHIPITTFCIYMSLIVPAIANEVLEVIPKPLTTEWVMHEIAKHGPKHAVNVLWDQERYDEMLGNISAGKEEWIALAPKIEPGTDAASSEDLGISLADALPKNPRAVLSILDQSKWTISFKRVCSIPFIEPTQKFFSDYARDALSAVQEINDGQLSEQKKLCLEKLEHASKAVREFSDQ